MNEKNQKLDVNNLSFKQLDIFIKTVDSGSSTRAAAVLGMSQPAVSRNLAQLEKTLGFSLFARTSGRLVPTKAGLRLHAEVAKAINAVQEIVMSAINTDSEEIDGQLRVAAIPSLSHSFLCNALSPFMQLYPQVSFSFETHASNAVMRIVADRSADLGIVSMPISHPGVQTETFFHPKAVCVIPRGHALAQKSTISIEDIAQYDQVTLSLQHFSRHRLEELAAIAGLKMSIKIETSSELMSCKLVQQGLGVAIVNQVTASSFKDKLEIRPFAHDMRHSYALAFPVNQPRTELAELYITILKQMVADLSVSTE